MADRQNEPTLSPPHGAPPPLAAEPPPWRGEERGSRAWWLLLILLILAGLGWYLWDKGHLARLEAAILGSPAPATPTLRATLDVTEAAELEALLAALALDPGPADGVLDAQTAAAIREFQAMAGLPADGKATPALLEELRAVAQQMGLTAQPAE